MRSYHFSIQFMAIVTITIATIGTSHAKTITFDFLLEEMVDRSTLADFPLPVYSCKQASSYDQHSVSADKPGWFANNDRSYFIRSGKNDGREEWVMMDAQGPGAITRWWVTSKKYLGTVRVYIDGSTKPVIEAKVDDLVGGTDLVGAPLSEESAGGRNLYLPIPYAKSCKVTFDRPNFQKTGNRDDIIYYQINYRTYTPGTKVESFTSSTVAESKSKIETIQKQLLNSTEVMPKQANQVFEESCVCQPGQSVSFPELKGSAAVCKITLKIEAKNRTQATRSTVIKATFDGEQTIWCPVGDFFGSGVGVNPFKGWYRQVEKDGTMNCWWVMPYEKSCILSVKNVGKEAIKIFATVETCPWNWTDRSMHFHTTWRQQRGIKTKGNRKNSTGEPDAFDWNYLKVDGKGVFVGDTLVILNRHPRWWGEGDEKIYVDGEKFPSHFGTGTEDYYGYAWGMTTFFESPFHAQPRAEGPKSYGNITNTRVRLLDDIPFKKSYHMDMEVWHWAATTMDYAVATYWYGRPGAKASYSPQPEEAALPVSYETLPKSADKETTSRAKRPNILWICTDQQRYDTIHALGNKYICTPNLDSLVKSGVAFTGAHCQSPICTPSRASFLTGMYPETVHECINGNDEWADAAPLITKTLADAGYDCGLAGKLHLSRAQGRVEKRPDDGYRVFHWSHHPSPDWPEGHAYDMWLKSQGMDFKKTYQKNGRSMPAMWHQTTWCTDRAIDFIKEKRDGPWLFSLNCFDPHPPVDPPKQYLKRFDVDSLPGPLFRSSDLKTQARLKDVQFQTKAKIYDEHDAKLYQARYWAQIELIDENVGRLLKVLEETGQRDNTIVIFTSDHGESLGDHGLRCKGCRFYEGLVRVPLIVSWPGKFKQNLQCDALVELVDITPTLLEVAGLPVSEAIQGRSLLPILTGQSDPKEHRDFVRCVYYAALQGPPTRATMIRTKDYKLVRYHGHELGELFDLRKDPNEFDNQWSNPEYKEIRQTLVEKNFDAAADAIDIGPRRTGRY